MEDQMDVLLERQWDGLRSWLAEVDILRYRDRASGLGTWTLGDLVAHLGYGLRMLTEVTAAPAGAAPMSLGRYVGAYPPAAPTIAEQTSGLAAELGDDLLRGVDAMVADAWRARRQISASVVLGRRGPLTRDDYLLTRLLELVVHGDDFHRALPEIQASPVVPDAAVAVAGALSAAYEERSGRPPTRTTPPLPWIRLAAGRVSSPDPHLPLL